MSLLQEMEQFGLADCPQNDKYKIDHVRILNAYISRLTTGDIESIVKQNSICDREMLNGNANSQLAAQSGMYAAICQSIENLPRYDKVLIESVLRDCIKDR
jgi:hypothetical protein